MTDGTEHMSRTTGFTHDEAPDPDPNKSAV